jgi:hypothetical protein
MIVAILVIKFEMTAYYRTDTRKTCAEIISVVKTENVNWKSFLQKITISMRGNKEKVF